MATNPPRMKKRWIWLSIACGLSLVVNAILLAAIIRLTRPWAVPGLSAPSGKPEATVQIPPEDASETPRIVTHGLSSPLKALMRGHRGSIRRLVFSADRKFLAVVTDENILTVWDLAALRLHLETRIPLTSRRNLAAGISAVTFMPNSRHLAVALAADRPWTTELQVIDLKERRARHVPLGPQLEGIKGLAISMAFAPDGRTLALGHLQGLLLMEYPSGDHPRALKLSKRSSFTLLSFSADGSTLVAHTDGKPGVAVFDVASGKSVTALATHDANPYERESIESLAISQDAKRVAAVNALNAVSLWELPSGRRILFEGQGIRSGDHPCWVGYQSGANILLTTSRGDSLDGHFARRYDATNGQLQAQVELPPASPPHPRVWPHQFSQDGTLLAATGAWDRAYEVDEARRTKAISDEYWCNESVVALYDLSQFVEQNDGKSSPAITARQNSDRSDSYLDGTR